MYSIRKWLYKPKKTDTSLLAQFFYADEELNMVAGELDSFDGRKDPERCSALVNQLRVCQDKVLHNIEKIMDEVIPLRRTSRDFRVKFPDDVLQERLSGQLWFGAECLAAGSSILNREVESTSMRPLAKALTRHLDYLRSVMRDQCLRNIAIYSDRIKEALVVFDRLFADFELSYVSAMVPVKTMREYDMLQDLTVLFCECVVRALKLKLLTQDMLDDYDPALMFTIPRLAIVCGLLVYPEGPLNPDQEAGNISEMFRPFQTLLFKIRELLWTLTKEELWALENSLSIAEEPSSFNDLDPVPYDRIEAMHRSTTPLPGGASAACSSKLDVDAEDNSFCRMVSSPSTDTVVPSPEACHGCTSLSVEGADGCFHHQESNDSGMLSDHSPENVRREGKQAASASDCHQVAPKTKEGRESVDLNGNPADSPRVESTTNIPRPQRQISHEFNFHLPLNTSADWSTVTGHGGDTPVIMMNADSASSVIEASPRIIYTSECLTPEDEMDGDGQQQISFVTETLNEVFVTDSSFQVLSRSVEDCGCRSSESDSKTGSSSDEDKIDSDAQQNTQSGVTCINNEITMHTSQPTTMSQSTKNNESGNAQMEVDAEYFKDKNNVTNTTIKCAKKSSNNKSKSDSNTEVSPSMHKRQTGRRLDGQTDRHMDGPSSSDCLEVPPRVQRLRYTESISSSCTSCHSVSSDCDWDRESYASSETSSYTSECQDDEEIALAIQAAENAARKEARARFHSSSDLIHRLYVCISGVADQLQTNYAAELRHVLKAVFECTASEEFLTLDDAVVVDEAEDVAHQMTADEENADHVTTSTHRGRHRSNQDPPLWVPDEQCPHCTSCKVPFTFVRRRHHCRNCGKIFCGRCSSNTATLPQYGHVKPVRVCNRCVMFHVNPFTVDE